MKMTQIFAVKKAKNIKLKRVDISSDGTALAKIWSDRSIDIIKSQYFFYIPLILNKLCAKKIRFKIWDLELNKRYWSRKHKKKVMK